MNVYRIVAMCMITVPVGIILESILGSILDFMSNREKREEDGNRKDD